MAQYEDEYDFNYEDDDEPTGSDLVKKLRKQIDALSKTIREKDEALSELQSYTFEVSVADTLSQWGLDPRIAKFIPDNVEDENDLALWLEEYGDVFGVEAVEGDGGRENDEQSPLDPEVVQAAELMAATEEGAIDPTVGLDVASRIEGANSADELLAMLRGS
jgi:hypothetical protein